MLKQLGEINVVTLELQKKRLYSITLQMGTGRANSGCDCGKKWQWVPFYQRKLGNHYIDPNAVIVKDPEFESGVTKIQRGEVSLMTEEEKKDLQKKKLQMVECDSSAALSSGPDSSRLAMTDRLERKNKKIWLPHFQVQVVNQVSHEVRSYRWARSPCDPGFLQCNNKIYVTKGRKVQFASMHFCCDNDQSQVPCPSSSWRPWTFCVFL